MNRQTLTHLSLGIPLTISGAATIATIFANKRLHIAFGAAWGVLSILHAFQHRKKMRTDVSRLCHTAERAIDKAENTTWNALLAGTDIASFTPGRVRVYNLALAGNDTLAHQLTTYVKSFAGVTDAVVNLVTGSMLITYIPEELRKHPRLKRLETYLAEHAKIK
ncbi:HMA2 domain-containing protein [Mitsuokella jalaludinii]|uniref:HMA2 domain-containing protein n=1 Tax=Mitsuokella jalaludinii TaxID=187979 RepID=UPI003F9D6C8A